MKIKNRRLLESVSALKTLDNPGDKERNKFGAVMTYQLAKNLRRLSDAAMDLETARKSLVKQFGIGQVDEKGPVKEDPVKLKAFQEEWAKLMEEDTELVVSTFKINNFDLQTNKIPIWVLATLDWMIIDEPTPAELPK